MGCAPLWQGRAHRLASLRAATGRGSCHVSSLPWDLPGEAGAARGPAVPGSARHALGRGRPVSADLPRSSARWGRACSTRLARPLPHSCSHPGLALGVGGGNQPPRHVRRGTAGGSRGPGQRAGWPAAAGSERVLDDVGVDPERRKRTPQHDAGSTSGARRRLASYLFSRNLFPHPGFPVSSFRPLRQPASARRPAAHAGGRLRLRGQVADFFSERVAWDPC